MRTRRGLFQATLRVEPTIATLALSEPVERFLAAEEGFDLMYLHALRADAHREDQATKRESVLAGRFFGDRHAETAAELAAFLHGGLDVASALQAYKQGTRSDETMKALAAALDEWPGPASG